MPLSGQEETRMATAAANSAGMGETRHRITCLSVGFPRDTRTARSLARIHLRFFPVGDPGRAGTAALFNT